MPLTSTERSRKRRAELKRKAADGDAAAEATLEKTKAYDRQKAKNTGERLTIHRDGNYPIIRIIG